MISSAALTASLVEAMSCGPAHASAAETLATQYPAHMQVWTYDHQALVVLQTIHYPYVTPSVLQALWEVADIDARTAGLLAKILQPFLSIGILLMIIRIVLSWYPQVHSPHYNVLIQHTAIAELLHCMVIEKPLHKAPFCVGANRDNAPGPGDHRITVA